MLRPDARHHNRVFSLDIREKDLELLREGLTRAATAFVADLALNPGMPATRATKLRRKAINMRLLALEITRKLAES